MADENRTVQPLASEMYEDLKKANAFKEKLIWCLLAVIAVFVL